MLNTEDLRHYTGIGTLYSPEMMMQRAADEIDGLRNRMVELLEILRRWEDGRNDEDLQTILQAMYQIGILIDPTETMRNMTKAPSYGPDNPPRLRMYGESLEEYRAAMGWGTFELTGWCAFAPAGLNDGFGCTPKKERDEPNRTPIGLLSRRMRRGGACCWKGASIRA